MTRQIWLNLPVKDIKRSKKFFTEIGFSFNEQHDTEFSTCMLIGSGNFVIMLFEEQAFEEITKSKVFNSKESTEMLISIDAESWEEVDAIAYNVEQSGGEVFSKPALSQGWMYGCGFTDLDGHRWGVLFMDYTKLS